MRKILLVFCFLQIGTITFSQCEKKEPFTLGVFIAKSDYIGDQDIQSFKLSHLKGAFGLNFFKVLNSNSSIGINVAIGQWGTSFNRSMGPLTGHTFNANYLLGDLNFRYKLKNSRKNSFIPFVSIGIGCRSLSKTSYPKLENYGRFDVISNNKRSIEPIIPMGLGFLYQINPKVNIQYQYTFGITTSDMHDFKEDNVSFLENDFYGINQIGIEFKLLNY